MKIAEDSLRQVLAATDIVDLIGNYVQLKKAGSAHKGLCPFHPEKTPSFTVSQSRQTFHCFGCQKGGDAITFVREHLSMPFSDAARFLAQRAGIVLVEEASDPQAESAHRQRGRLIKLHNDAARWMHDLLLKMRGTGPDAAREYLKGRGLNRDVAQRWLIGYAPDDIRLWREWARSKGYRDDILIESGLFIPKVEGQPAAGGYVRFRHRVMFPVRNDQGDVIAFSGRILDPDQKGGKYVNSPETPLFNKSQVLFGWDRTRRPVTKADCAIICEGQIDLITACEHGIENIVAPLGTAFTEHHARLIHRAAGRAVLCFDADNAGYKAALRCFQLLAPEGVFVRVAALPQGEDPDSLIRGKGPDIFRGLIENAKDFFDFQIDLHPAAMLPDNVLEKSRLVAALAENLVLLSDKIAQDAAINRCATRLNIPGSDIRQMLSREAAKKRRDEASRRDAAARQADARNSAAAAATTASGGGAGGATTGGSAGENGNSATSAAQRTANGGHGTGSGGQNPPSAGQVIDNWALRHLIRMALTQEDCHEWLKERFGDDDCPWRHHAGGKCLERILAASFPGDDPAARSALLAAFPDDERSFISSLLVSRAPKDDIQGVKGMFYRLKMDNIRRQQEILAQRMRLPGLPAEEIVRITNDLVQLKKQEAQLTPLLPVITVPG
jgi:DNA primase